MVQVISYVVRRLLPAMFEWFWNILYNLGMSDVGAAALRLFPHAGMSSCSHGDIGAWRVAGSSPDRAGCSAVTLRMDQVCALNAPSSAKARLSSAFVPTGSARLHGAGLVLTPIVLGGLNGVLDAYCYSLCTPRSGLAHKNARCLFLGLDNVR